MSNKRDRRRKGVIYPGQSGTGRSQNTFFTEAEKSQFAANINKNFRIACFNY